jgi:hypothetical protein
MIGDRVTGPGVMVLAMEDLFAAIESTKLDSAYELSLSYLEVYNETIRDLLAPEAHATAPVEGAPPPPAALDAAGGATPRVRPTGPTGGLTLREDPHGGIQVTGLSRHSPNSADQVLELLQRGNGNRAMSATHANAVSSRSHAVLQITVRETAKTADVTADVRVGKLSLIDLAGSERASVTANRGVQLHEGANINKSLLALSNCINALGKAKGDLRHIPYRDSKLTRLLKDSLGGNCKTTMIAAVSPSRASYEDTLNTLKYANRAKEIKLLASQNSVKVDFHIAKYAQIIAQLREEVGVWRGKHAQAVAGLAPAAALAQQPDGGLAPPSAGALAAAAAAVDRQRGQAAYSRIEQTYSVAANALQHLAELRLREREAADALASAKEATAFADAKLGEARALADADAHAASPAALLRAEADAESALEGVARAQASSAKYAQMRKRLHATLSEAYAAFDKLDRALSEPAADGDDDAPPSADGGGGGAEGASLYVRSEERRALLQQEIRCRVLQLRNLDLTAKLRVQQPQPVAVSAPRGLARSTVAARPFGGGLPSRRWLGSLTSRLPRCAPRAPPLSRCPQPQPPALQPAPSQPQSESVVVAELWALVRAQSDLLEQSQLSTPTLAAAYAEAARRCAAVEPTAGSSSACAGLADADDLSLRLSLNAETRAHVQDAPGATPQGLAAADVEHTYAFGSSSASKEKLLASRAAPIPSPAVRRSIGAWPRAALHVPCARRWVQLSHLFSTLSASTAPARQNLLAQPACAQPACAQPACAARAGQPARIRGRRRSARKAASCRCRAAAAATRRVARARAAAAPAKAPHRRRGGRRRGRAAAHVGGGRGRARGQGLQPDRPRRRRAAPVHELDELLVARRGQAPAGERERRRGGARAQRAVAQPRPNRRATAAGHARRRPARLRRRQRRERAQAERRRRQGAAGQDGCLLAALFKLDRLAGGRAAPEVRRAVGRCADRARAAWRRQPRRRRAGRRPRREPAADGKRRTDRARDGARNHAGRSQAADVCAARSGGRPGGSRRRPEAGIIPLDVNHQPTARPVAFATLRHAVASRYTLSTPQSAFKAGAGGTVSSDERGRRRREQGLRRPGTAA